jgi:DNA-binding HxlR family transcriptional regulator
LAAEQDLVEFVREHVRSVWALELLLLLKRDTERCWSAPDLVRELRASTTLVNDNLQRFVRSGLVTRDEEACYRYTPAGTVLANLCDGLEAAYRERPVAVINMIAAPPNPIQSLADAFRFRGEDK